MQLAGHRQHLDRLLERDVLVARLLEQLRHHRREEPLLREDLLGDDVSHLREVRSHLAGEGAEVGDLLFAEELEVVRAGFLSHGYAVQ